MISYQTTCKKCHIKHIIPLINPAECGIYCRERLLSQLSVKPHKCKKRAARIVLEILEGRRMRQLATLTYKITHDISPPHLRNKKLIRGRPCKILKTSFAHKIDFAHNFSFDFC